MTNDLLKQGDAGDYFIRVMLDLTSTFDTADLNILVSGAALQYFSSYLSEKYFKITNI